MIENVSDIVETGKGQLDEILLPAGTNSVQATRLYLLLFPAPCFGKKFRLVAAPLTALYENILNS